MIEYIIETDPRPDGRNGGFVYAQDDTEALLLASQKYGQGNLKVVYREHETGSAGPYVVLLDRDSTFGKNLMPGSWVAKLTEEESES